MSSIGNTLEEIPSKSAERKGVQLGAAAAKFAAREKGLREESLCDLSAVEEANIGPRASEVSQGHSVER